MPYENDDHSSCVEHVAPPHTRITLQALCCLNSCCVKLNSAAPSMSLGGTPALHCEATLLNLTGNLTGRSTERHVAPLHARIIQVELPCGRRFASETPPRRACRSAARPPRHHFATLLGNSAAPIMSLRVRGRPSASESDSEPQPPDGWPGRNAGAGVTVRHGAAGHRDRHRDGPGGTDSRRLG